MILLKQYKSTLHLPILGIFLLFVLFASQPVHAAQTDYLFSIPEVQMQVYVQRDASIRIEYQMVFQNTANGKPIDIIDIGTPTSAYNISNMQASINGNRLTDIRRSEFVNPGVEIHLGSHTIPPSQRGTFQFIFTMPNMIFEDVTNNELATMQITPTWFGGQYVQGNTNLQIAIHLPEGVPADTTQVLSQETEYTQLAIFQGRTVAYWSFPTSRFTNAHMVGLSFPRNVMDNVVEMTAWQLATLWFESHPNLRLVMGVVAVVLFSIAFFRFSGNTGWSVWLIVTGVSTFLFINNAGIQLLCFLPIIFFFIINEYRIRQHKKTYLPAIAHVEGGGIKRGLTAPEAAALLELPLNKVLTLVIFGMLQKGLLEQTESDPLTVTLPESMATIKIKADKEQDIQKNLELLREELRKEGKTDEDFDKMSLKEIRERLKDDARIEQVSTVGKGVVRVERRKRAQEMGIVIHHYEENFLDVIERASGKPIHKIDFTAPMKGLLQWVVKRVKGFNIKETKEYYERIVARAMTEAKTVGDIPEFELTVDRNLGWLMMADDFSTVFNRPQWGGYHYYPSWTRPMSSGMGRSSSTGSSGLPTTTSAPTFSNVAAGFAGWTENTMGNLASTILPAKIIGEGTGAVNLGGFDTATANFFEAMASSSGGSGGSGGCACAGCACACACAGGGR